MVVLPDRRATTPGQRNNQKRNRSDGGFGLPAQTLSASKLIPPAPAVARFAQLGPDDIRQLQILFKSSHKTRSSAVQKSLSARTTHQRKCGGRFDREPEKTPPQLALA
jgi:hypothetical protein